MSMRRPIVGVTVGTPIGPDSLLNKLNISKAIEDYLKNNPPVSGEDGYSPTVSVSEIEGGYRITITDANETKEIDILHGTKGNTGEPGKDGEQGPQGPAGTDGQNGASFIPTIDDEFNLSWTNDHGLENPPTVNIKGPQGDPGDPYELTEEDVQRIIDDISDAGIACKTEEAITVNGVTGLGITDGATIPAGTSFSDFVKMVVQKAIPATYTKPTVSIANNGGQASGNVEAGSSITPKLKATFTKNDAGNLTKIAIKKGSTEVSTGTTSPLTYTGSALTIGDETITFSATATYGDAPIKQNNLGQNSTENWFAGSSVSSSNYSIVGKRNMFYGTGVGAVPTVNSVMVRGLANTKLAPANGTSITINVAVGQQYIVFAYPATLRDVNNVTYVEANDSGMASSFTKTTVNVADARGGSNGMMSYKVYTYAMAVPAAAGMTFKVTI